MTDVWQLPAMWTLEDKTTVAICDTGSNYESGSCGLTLSLKPSAAIWTMRSNGVTIRYPIGRRQKVIFINKGRPDSGLPWRKTANGTAKRTNSFALRYRK